MSPNDQLLLERLLAWGIRDDMVTLRRARQAGPEPYLATLRREQLLNTWLRTLIRRAALLLVLCLLWPVLPASAPPAVARQDARCLEVNAAFVLRQSVEREIQSNGVTISVPAGYAVAWSCASLDEAEIELARRVAEIQAERP